MRRRIVALAVMLAVASALFMNGELGISAQARNSRVERVMVIAIDTHGQGKDYVRELYDTVASYYAQIGEDFVLAAEDFLYFTQLPAGWSGEQGEPNGRGTVNALIKLFEVLGISPKGRQRIFLYHSDPSHWFHVVEEACVGRNANPVMFGGTDPWETDLIITTLGQISLHGAAHGAESMSAFAVSDKKLVSQDEAFAFFRETGNCHLVTAAYLRSVGLQPDESYWRKELHNLSPTDGSDPYIYGYHYMLVYEADVSTTPSGSVVEWHYAMSYFVWFINQVYDKFDCQDYLWDFLFGRIEPLKNLDSASEWAREAITGAVVKGFVPYDLQSSYRSVITRAEFCRLAMRWMQYATGKSSDAILAEKGLARDASAFTDTSDPDILAAYALGITNGVGNRQFNPDGQFDRQQAATMIMNVCRALGVEVSSPPPSGFADLKDAADWARQGIDFVRANGIMSGVGNNYFDPKALYTREQSIMTFNNIKVQVLLG